MRPLALSLIFFLPLVGQTVKQSIGSGGGGASAANDLSDVTLTSPASGDGWYYNGTAWINGALFTAGTTDILAARMSANVRTAVGSGLANGYIPFVEGGTVVTNGTGPVAISVGGSDRLWVDASGHTRIAQGRSLVLDGTTNQAYMYISANDWYYRVAAGNFYDFQINLASQLQIGGSNTVLVKDTTATTGITRDRCEDGAGQGVVACRQTEGFASFDGVTFSELSTQADGTYTYCTDCSSAATCASGGSGAFAKKINGAWNCH
jgi:hypothetical protein